ncbi:hypothetical protein B296_00012518 [Ensete ventricosum]|uniref:Uncharacterized protein n=1 Tax=Ensete ventricosum TaxID=4639 RepID=A0A426Z8D7_ENSVE|nr:hypothetical protein B296_00012518 [Ensete ventricosum]
MAMASSSLSTWSMASLRSALPPSPSPSPSPRLPSFRFPTPSPFHCSARLSSGRGQAKPLRSFSGLAPMTPLLSVGIGK